MGSGAIDDLLAGVFPPDVMVCSSAIGALEGELYPEELACIRTAVDKRRREFLAGRICARRLLAQMGYERFPLVANPDRTVAWPQDVVGSISHSASHCAVVVARSERIRSIGLDVDTPEPLAPEYWEMILSEGEREWVRARPAPERGGLAKLVFCAKESIFKCQFAVTRRYLNFSDVEIRLSMRGSTITAVPKSSRDEVLSKIEGRFRRDSRAVVCGTVLLP